MRVTINNINKALAARGHNAQIVKGECYFYFIGEDCGAWVTTSVFSPRLTDDTVDGWIDSYEMMAKNPMINPYAYD